jgi:3-methyladenine DNA glycosylase Tag
MAPASEARAPKDDADYLDRLSKAVFSAGLNWRMVDGKWPGSRTAFHGFAPAKVAKLTEKDVADLMKNPAIVRNERKVRATIENAKSVLGIEKEYGSFKAYIDSFGKRESDLIGEIQLKFKHVGPSTARTFLWMAGYPLSPTQEERAWMKGNGGH